MDHYYRAEKTRNLPVFRAFQQTYVGAIGIFFFLSGCLKNIEYLFLFLSVISQRDKAQRKILGACNLSELKGWPVSQPLWQDCA